MLLYEARLLEFTDLEYLIYLKICLLGHQDYIKKFQTHFINSSRNLHVKYGKGGLISKSLSLWMKTPKKGARNYPEHYPKDAQDSDMAPFWGDSGQSEKHF